MLDVTTSLKGFAEGKREEQDAGVVMGNALLNAGACRDAQGHAGGK